MIKRKVLGTKDCSVHRYVASYKHICIGLWSHLPSEECVFVSWHLTFILIESKEFLSWVPKLWVMLLYFLKNWKVKKKAQGRVRQNYLLTKYPRCRIRRVVGRVMREVGQEANISKIVRLWGFEHYPITSDCQMENLC